MDATVERPTCSVAVLSPRFVESVEKFAYVVVDNVDRMLLRFPMEVERAWPTPVDTVDRLVRLLLTKVENVDEKLVLRNIRPVQIFSLS